MKELLEELKEKFKENKSKLVIGTICLIVIILSFCFFSIGASIVITILTIIAGFGVWLLTEIGGFKINF
jgi:hypothetical protein